MILVEVAGRRFAVSEEEFAQYGEENCWEPVEQQQAAPSVAKNTQQDAHKAAARYYWAAAFLAIKAKNIDLARAFRKQAEDAERNAAPDALLTAIFGGPTREAEARAVAEGEKISPEMADKAKQGTREFFKPRQKAQKQAAQKSAKPASSPARAAVQDAVRAAGGCVKAAELEAKYGRIVCIAMLRDGQLIETSEGYKI